MADSGEITLQADTGAGLVLVPGCTDFSGPSLGVEVVDTTDMDSTSNWEEHIAGKKMIGDLSFTLHYEPDDTVHRWLHDSVGVAGKSWNIIFASTDAIAFTGMITQFEPSGEQNGKLLVAVTVRGSGVPTLPA